MSPPLSILLFLTLLVGTVAAEPEFPLTADSMPQAGVPKGTMIKGSHKSAQDSVFPGTEREYQIYVPQGHDQTKPAAFMVFQDGVIYQAPVVFDNLIARQDIPPLVGIFIKPGVVPADGDNALPRFNRSHEYDSITPTYSGFLIDEFLPAIEARHGLRLSRDPNQAAIAGNSSGGICAFMTAWHRPDRFRRVFTGVGTYVGIHGADRLPVLVRKMEPKPLRVFLQSGTGDNNLYCGDWWMANLTMERSLAWAGYDVNHAWGEGGHNQKHASQIFPEVMRWLWRDWRTTMEVRANPQGTSKWRGYEVLGEGGWEKVLHEPVNPDLGTSPLMNRMAACADGTLFIEKHSPEKDIVLFVRIDASGARQEVKVRAQGMLNGFRAGPGGGLRLFFSALPAQKEARILNVTPNGQVVNEIRFGDKSGKYDSPFSNHACLSCDSLGRLYFAGCNDALIGRVDPAGNYEFLHGESLQSEVLVTSGGSLCLSPDQSLLYISAPDGWIDSVQLRSSPPLFQHAQPFFQREPSWGPRQEQSLQAAMCVDSHGWLYVASSLGIQVCDQAGRVNFIIPTPKPAKDLCFGGKDLSELYISCGDTVYKRRTKARGVVSGQQPPVKPPLPKL